MRYGLISSPQSLIEIPEADEPPRVRQPVQTLVASPPRPEAVLVLAAHRPLEVDAPGVRVRIEVERAERNFDFERPADAAVPDLGVPDAVPLPVREAGAAQRVAHQARRVHFEEVAGLLIVERVDVPHEPVVRLQELVPPSLVSEPALRLGVEAGDPHVERLPGEHDAHFGLLGGRRAVVGILLHESGRRHGARPHGFIQSAVEHDGLVVGETDRCDAAGLDFASRRRRLRGGLRGGGRRSEQARSGSEYGTSKHKGSAREAAAASE